MQSSILLNVLDFHIGTTPALRVGQPKISPIPNMNGGYIKPELEMP